MTKMTPAETSANVCYANKRVNDANKRAINANNRFYLTIFYVIFKGSVLAVKRAEPNMRMLLPVTLIVIQIK